MPTRLQKRWSGRLRTAGALLSLLGAVALADYALGLGAPRSTLVSSETRTAALVAGIALVAIGIASYGLGRRWR